MTYNPTATGNIYPHNTIRVARSEKIFDARYDINSKTVYIIDSISDIINTVHEKYEAGYDFEIVQVINNTTVENINKAEMHYYLSNANPSGPHYVFASARNFRNMNLSTEKSWIDAIQESVSDVSEEDTTNGFTYNRIITVPDQDGSDYYTLLTNFAESLSTTNYIIFDGSNSKIEMSGVTVSTDSSANPNMSFYIVYRGHRSYNNRNLTNIYPQTGAQ